MDKETKKGEKTSNGLEDRDRGLRSRKEEERTNKRESQLDRGL